MTPTPAKPATPRALHCIRCGYDLRALDAAGDCPECGLAIDCSAEGDHLQFADPNWLFWLRLGALAMVLAVCLELVNQCFWFWFSRSSGLARAISPIIMLWQVSWYVWALLFAAGVVLLCRIDPATPRNQRPWVNRLPLPAMGLLVVLHVITFAVYRFSPASGSDLTALVALGAGVVQWLIETALMLCVLVVLYRLIRRMRANTLRIALIVAVFVVAPAYLLDLAARLLGALLAFDGMLTELAWSSHGFVSTARRYYAFLPIVLGIVFYAALWFALLKTERQARAQAVATDRAGSKINRPADVGGTPDGP